MQAAVHRRLRRHILVVAILAPLATIVIACSSSSDAAPDPTGSCGVLATRCHPYDKVTAIGKECHALGHDGDDLKCAPRKEECLAACPPTEAGTSHPAADASTTDANVDPDAVVEAAPDSGDVCTPFCQCLTDTCSSIAGYPFTSTADCVAKCPLTTADLRVCLPKWCEKAKTLSDKTHTCDHAAGKLGNDECETL